MGNRIGISNEKKAGEDFLCPTLLESMGPFRPGRIALSRRTRGALVHPPLQLTFRYVIAVAGLAGFVGTLLGQDQPEDLLRQANQLADAGNLAAARPLYAKAEQAYTQSGDRKQALYAKFGRLRRDVESGSYDAYLREIDADLATPEVGADQIGRAHV